MQKPNYWLMSLVVVLAVVVGIVGGGVMGGVAGYYAAQLSAPTNAAAPASAARTPLAQARRASSGMVTGFLSRRAGRLRSVRRCRGARACRAGWRWPCAGARR